MNVDKDTKQDATVDENDNSIEYHSTTKDYELWVVDDFNKVSLKQTAICLPKALS